MNSDVDNDEDNACKGAATGDNNGDDVWVVFQTQFDAADIIGCSNVVDAFETADSIIFRDFFCKSSNGICVTRSWIVVINVEDSNEDVTPSLIFATRSEALSMNSLYCSETSDTIS